MGALAAVVVVGTLGSCGVGPSHTLNSTSLEKQIAEQLGSRYPVGRPTVTCPGSIPDRDGTGFVCEASFGSQRVSLQGTVTSSAGQYNIQPADAIVATAQAASTLGQDIGTDLHTSVKVDCGPSPVRVVPTGATFQCVADISGQGRRTVTVTVDDLAGHFRYSVSTAGG